MVEPIRIFGLIFLILFSSLLHAKLAINEAEEIVHSFKAGIIKVVNSNNPSNLADFFEPDALMVLGNAKLIRSQDTIRVFMQAPYLEEDLKISHFVIDKIDVDPVIAILDDNTFISTGTAHYKIVFNKAKRITLPNRWIATFHRKEGRWGIASYQGTVNAFDNPYIEDMRNIFHLISLVTFLLGIIVAVAWRRIKKRRIA